MTKKSNEHDSKASHKGLGGALLQQDDFLGTDDFFGRRLAARIMRGMAMHEPVVDVFETKDEVVATIELPGTRKEDISLNVSSSSLVFEIRKGHREEKKGEGTYEYSARFEGYSRTVPLPAQVQSAKAKATYKNGVLEVRMPKAEKESGGGNVKIE